tara:strand:+ start:264 stop:593 length:330 start_codon:yes stop_codon:yes gene_type:complete
MIDIVIKSIIGGIIIGVVSTLAQKNPTAGAFIMGIPIVSFITLAMMWYAGVDYQTFKTFSWETIYFVFLSLSFFPVFILLMPYIGFWFSLVSGASVAGALMLLALNLKL